MQKRIIYFSLFFFLLSSCVTPKIHNALLEEHKLLKQNFNLAEKKVIALDNQIQKHELAIVNLKRQLSVLRNDSLHKSKNLTALDSKYNQLSDAYDLLVSKNSRYMADKAKEAKKLLEQLEKTQLELFSKEDQLNNLSNSLTLKKQELQERSARVSELEGMIVKKDSIVTALKQSISNALIGLEGEGLTIEKRNGKVYLSLEEELLFPSGQYKINSSGVIALNKLANALALQKDLDILVEGHTDSIPVSSKKLIKDNWDLSVMRATNVVKVLLNNPSLNPLQLTAAGKGQFSPLATNTNQEGRRMNRRIEIILSPNLGDLFKLLEK